ncbi:BTAD domain-containing putative transcriptional regulator [Streptomyces cuspidosporus]|uniref:BTAD domain-containing putative transcriptional regulator n=1 Tax=Streptomyces cuspidosporus TaxID=66882 RepID=A0ABN3GQA7_9ACTN
MAQDPVRFALLGPLRAWRGETELDLGRPQRRALLALLLAGAGRTVSMEGLIDGLWSQDPPESAANVIHRHVGAVRRLLEPGLPTRAAGRWLLRGAGGYRLEVDADSLDLLRFRGLRDAARQAAEEGAAGRAVTLILEALALWQGPAAAGIAPAVRDRPAFASLDREHLAAVKESADLALSAGLAEPVLPGLRAAAAGSPLDEPLLSRLVLVLAATGHRSEALEVYEGARARLADELGISPGAELLAARTAAAGTAPPTTARAANQAGVPAGGPGGGGAGRAAHDGPPGSAGFAAPSPAQLPPDLPVFTGRRAELAEVLARLPGEARTASTVLISAIGGMAGIGKTTLAVHWAHRVRDRFPDGQLYVNLRGFDPTGPAMSPGEAVRGFLVALGVPPQHIPNGVDDQAALYRSLLAGRRVLVLLDNALSTDQVRPLLPGSRDCLTIVTSRNQLQGLLAAYGAHALSLRPLDVDDAREFLARRLGDDRVASAPGAVAEIAERCAGLPLALACVAARAALRPDVPLSVVAEELRESRGGLDVFTGGEVSTDVAAVFSWSYRAVPPAAARLFRLLGLQAGPDVSAEAAASLAGLPAREARPLLAELARVQLISEHAPGRYVLHDLLRAYSQELARTDEPERERRAAVHRLLDHYVHAAHAADLLLAPHLDPIPPTPPRPGAVLESFPDRERALAWLAAEYPALLLAVDDAARNGFDSHACRLAWALEAFFDRRGHWHDWAAAQRTALRCALRTAEPGMEARALRALARVEGRLGRHDEARAHLERALRLFTELGDDIGRGNTHRSLGWTADQQGDLRAALRHNQEALELLRAADDRPAWASVLASVGWYHALLGEFDVALSHCRAALPVLREHGDRYGEAAARHTVGYLHQQAGRHPGAVSAYRDALTVYRELGAPYMEAQTLTDLGDVHSALGDAESAEDAWRQALALLTGLGHPDARKVGERLTASGRAPRD